MAHNELILNFRGKAPPENKFFFLSFELRHSLQVRNDKGGAYALHLNGEIASPLLLEVICKI